MRELGAADSLMSGSGPTVFGIFRQEDLKLAEAALEQFGQEDLAGQALAILAGEDGLTQCIEYHVPKR